LPNQCGLTAVGWTGNEKIKRLLLPIAFKKYHLIEVIYDGFIANPGVKNGQL